MTRRYLRLPVSWHQRHATGTLLSNANSDVEAAWFPIAPMPFAVGTAVMLVGAIGAVFVTDPALGLVALGIFPALLALNVFYSRRMAPRQARAQQLRAEVSAIGARELRRRAGGQDHGAGGGGDPAVRGQGGASCATR